MIADRMVAFYAPMRRLAPAAFLLLVACSGLVVYQRAESDTLYFGTAKADGTFFIASPFHCAVGTKPP